MADILQVTKLVFANIGDPKKALALMPDNEKEAPIGYIMGIASDIHRVERTKPDGSGKEIFVGMKGTFEGMPADPTKDGYTSGICYMPEAFLTQLFEQLFSEENGGTKWAGNPWSDKYEAGKPGKPIKFAAESGILRANNPQGYSWYLRPVGERQSYDPLADMREAIRGDKGQRKLAKPEVLDLQANKPAEKVTAKK